MPTPSYEQLVGLKSIKASTSLVASQFCFVKIDASGLLALPTSGGYAEGVLQDKPLQNDPGLVCGPGSITKVLCGNTITPGQDLMSDSSGNAVPATSGSFVLGQALTGGSAATIATIVYQPKGSKL